MQHRIIANVEDFHHHRIEIAKGRPQHHGRVQTNVFRRLKLKVCEAHGGDEGEEDEGRACRKGNESAGGSWYAGWMAGTEGEGLPAKEGADGWEI
jgi:hypothetical protein